MNHQQLEIQQRSEQSLRKQTSFSKLFDFSSFKCQYSNTNNMRTAKQHQRSKTLLVSNYLCKRQGNMLKKVTQIRLDDKIITIQDRYQMIILQQTKKLLPIKIQTLQNIQENSLDSDHGSLEKRKMIRKKTNKTLMPKKRHLKLNQNFQSQQVKRDTKNVPRNISRAFSNYLYEQRKPQFQEMVKLTEKLGYNNSLVEQIIKEHGLACRFKQFLIEHSQIWLDGSRIKDKKSHNEAIDIYLKMIEEQMVSQADQCLSLSSNQIIQNDSN